MSNPTTVPAERESSVRPCPPSPIHRWLRAVDPCLVGCCLTAAAVYLVHGFGGDLSRDLGLYSYSGQQVADGHAPYVETMNRAGPLAQLVPGIATLASRCVGVDDVLGMRVFFMLLAVACIGLSYLLGRDVFRSRPAGLATAAALLSIEGFTHYATYGPREKTTMVLFLLAGLLAIVHQRWGRAGCCAALAALTLQPALVVGLAAAVVAALVGARGARLRALVRIAVGGLVPLAAFVVCYAAIGHLGTFLDDFLLINARYTQQQSLFDYPDLFWPAMSEAYGWSLWLYFVGPAALLLSTVVAVCRRVERTTRETAALVGALAGWAAGMLWLDRAFNGWPDPFFLLPAATLGIGGLVALSARLLPQRVPVGATVAWCLVATSLATAYAVRDREHVLDGERADVAAVMRLLPHDATILSVEAPQPLVLAGKQNPSDLQLFGNGLSDYVEATWPGGLAGYGAWIGEQAPTVIAVGDTDPVPPSWLRPTLNADYVEVGTSTGWTWYVRTDLGEATVRAARRALATGTVAG